MPDIILAIPNRPTLAHLTQMLEHEGFSVSGHTRPEPALSRISAAPPDLVILDTALPHMAGETLIRRVVAASAVPVLAMVHARNALAEVRYLTCGADDVVERSGPDEVFLARVHALLRRPACTAHAAPDAVLDQPAVRRGGLIMQPATQSVTWHGTEVALTVTEFRILHALASHPEMIRTRNHLQDIVYGDDIHVIDRAIDSHIKRLRQKMRAVDPAFAGIRTVYGLGYRYGPEPVARRALALVG